MDKMVLSSMLMWLGIAGAILTIIYMLIANPMALLGILAFGALWVVGYFIKKENRGY